MSVEYLPVVPILLLGTPRNNTEKQRREAMSLQIKPQSECRWDLVSLGEVMLRLDPGEGRVSTARTFHAHEGGGEYNVARGLRRCFGMETAHVTALVDNPIGRLIEDLMRQGGVDLSSLIWVPFDGIGRAARNGLNFTERGFGVRAARGCSDRAHTAAMAMQPGEIDWDEIFGEQGARWFHTGGIFAALSDSTAALTAEAMQAAHRHGTIVSFDLNYRASLWQAGGGQERAREVNRELAPLIDVMLGNEEDFTAALGFEVEGVDDNLSKLDPTCFHRMIEEAVSLFPNLQVVATTLRHAKTATRNDWGAVCYADGTLFRAVERPELEILDRVGGGDSFASGLIFGFLTGHDPAWSVECGAAHGALAMTTPGDTTMATLDEVERLMAGDSARVQR
jgi:2-dehydro-3-deoxygluconokinase